MSANWFNPFWLPSCTDFLLKFLPQSIFTLPPAIVRNKSCSEYNVLGTPTSQVKTRFQLPVYACHVGRPTKAAGKTQKEGATFCGDVLGHGPMN